jgi:hypothetical protein
MLAMLFLAGTLATPLLAQPPWKGDPERVNEGDVQFSLTPRDVTGGRFRVDIVVTTHSGDLAVLDLRQAVELRVEGRALRPVEAPKLRGHHVRGRIEFDLNRVPDAFEIVISGVPAMDTLTFRWP